jgi:O-antigen/teichoic acid export membrane protein
MSRFQLVNRKFTLTQRALLTLAGSLLVQAAEFLTGFFITPYIIHGLGQELYGAWGMIQQAISYFSLTDFRAPTALRFLLQLKQHEEDPESKQRLIGASLVLWGICLPLAIVLGVVLIQFAPLIIRMSPGNDAPVRIALAVLLVNSVIDRVLSIPMHILRAQNMDYVGMGINTLTVLGGSLLSALAIWLGFGLPGLAIATMLNIMLISIGRFAIARRALPWISAKIPSRDVFVSFFKTSAWLLFIGLGGMLAYTTDTMLVGFILGPSIAAVYISTGLVMRMVGEPMYQVISSGNAGLIGLCGQKDWERVATVRKEMYFILLFFMTILGTGVIALNRSFLSLWLGPQFFGGSLLTAGIVLSMVVLFLSRIDLLITDAMLFLREKTWAFWGAGLIVITSAFMFIKYFGPAGMAVSTLLGNLCLLVVSWILINKRMGSLGIGLFKSLFLPVCAMLILFSLALIFENSIHAETWLSFIVYTFSIGLISLVIGWLIVLPANIRIILFNRAKQNIPFLK